ncbi:MAG: ATP phosphoribosyltransferase regulatory subunit, partial [Caldilineaceae bacterium]|nr:ATP phosphoribosyltransferase regulatory subunit [Caldilineaceae bacterium]
VAIDKLDKIGLDGVRRELEQRGIASPAAEKLLATMDAAPTGNGELIPWLSDLLAESTLGRQGVEDLEKILGFSTGSPAERRLRVDPYLARGLSYYTGAIYEIEFPGLSGSGGGGGRYDELIGMFSGQSIPSCGFSFGLERVVLIMEERALFPQQLAGQPQVLVTQFDETTIDASLALTRALRAEGLRVDLYPDPDRYGRQFKYAEDRRIRYALLLSPNELAQGVVVVKDLVSGEQVEVPPSAVADWLHGHVA